MCLLVMAQVTGLTSGAAAQPESWILLESDPGAFCQFLPSIGQMCSPAGPCPQSNFSLTSCLPDPRHSACGCSDGRCRLLRLRWAARWSLGMKARG